MHPVHYVLQKLRQTLPIYWELARITVPIAAITELAARAGVIDGLAPVFGPVMGLFGLPPELALAWITGLLVGVWAGLASLLTLMPGAAVSTADVTVFSALLLFAHALPIEQKIIQRAGPRFLVTTLLRLGGGILYAVFLHQVLSLTGWLSEPANFLWAPAAEARTWSAWAWGMTELLVWMFVILLGLSILLDVLRRSGLMDLCLRAIGPVLSLAGIRGEARQFAAIGLFLGISYGGGFLIAEARSGAIPRQQVFIACVYMGFAHSLIEDTLIVMSVGADVWAVLLGRVAFATLATAMIAYFIPSDSGHSQ